MKGPAKPLQNLSSEERGLLLFLNYLPQPISIDTLCSFSTTPVSNILDLMDKLKKKGIVQEKKRGKRLYSLSDTALTDLISINNTSVEVLKKIITHHEQTGGAEPERVLILADLYCKSGDIEQGLKHINNAAAILAYSGKKDKAIAYYDLLLKYLSQKPMAGPDVALFLDSALGKIHTVGHAYTKEYLLLLWKAHRTAKQHCMWDYLAKIELALGLLSEGSGEHEKASRHIKESWRLAEKTGNKELIKSIAMGIADYLHWTGRYSETIRYYEEVVGNLEEFGDSEPALKSAALLGYCYSVCGRVSKGLGMLETVRAKAQMLGFHTVVVFADLMSAVCLLMIKKTVEAEACLNRASADIDNVIDHLVLWGLNDCRACISCLKGDYEKALEYQQKSVDHSHSIGWHHRCGPTYLEYSNILEAKGLVLKKTSLDQTIKELLLADDIFMKGIALRYRAIRNIRKNGPEDKIVSDLQKSGIYLNDAGAVIDLAYTNIALGEYYLNKNKTKKAQAYLEKAWAVLSKINKDIFPERLLAAMPRERKIEVMIDRMIKINESLGAIHDRSAFLEQVINVAMDFSMAMTGVFRKLEPDGTTKIIASRNLDPALIDARHSGHIPLIESAAQKGAELIFPESDKKRSELHVIFHAAGIDSLVAMPVKLNNHIEGYLCLGNHFDGKPFPENQLPYIRLLCNLIAVGLANIEMYEELKTRFVEKEEEASFYKKEMGIAAIVIGHSKSMKNVMDRIGQVAPTDSSVLILGETGVGKELAAKSIHNLSGRRDGPFIPVNLATLPSELVASELFGHEKGAFTGANERHKGRFELADGGTIFLDEIGDLPSGVQVKLLRVLQEGTFERLGSAKQIRSDFRIIAATHKDLRIETERGAFRQDLYYRLNVFPLHIPPLRDRREDISLLAQHFLDTFCRKMGKKIGKIPKEELKKLMNYHWPGNVRELEHFIERAVILSDGHGISFSELDYSPEEQTIKNGDGNHLSLADVERDHILKVLASTLWRIRGPQGAASILGLKPSTLLFRMGKLGIKKPVKSSSEKQGSRGQGF